MPTRPAYVWDGTQWNDIGAPVSRPATAFYASTAPISPTTGDIWVDSSLKVAKVWNGSSWDPLSISATGGGTDKVFYESGQSITANYTITTGTNAMSTGPVSIASGVTVTIPSGSTWAVI